MIKRFFDIIFSLLGLVLLFPLFVIISLLVAITSSGGIFYKQNRVGKNGIDFLLLKFRTMRVGSDQQGLLTVGGRDSRITSIGYFLRKYKMDELPQLFNVLLGHMSLVGPRPEVRKYVDLYSAEQLKVLTVRPGITDYASIEYMDENELLGKADNPERLYIEEIMPKKLSLNLRYIQEKSLMADLSIITKTLLKIIR